MTCTSLPIASKVNQLGFNTIPSGHKYNQGSVSTRFSTPLSRTETLFLLLAKTKRCIQGEPIGFNSIPSGPKDQGSVSTRFSTSHSPAETLSFLRAQAKRCIPFSPTRRHQAEKPHPRYTFPEMTSCSQIIQRQRKSITEQQKLTNKLQNTVQYWTQYGKRMISSNPPGGSHRQFLLSPGEKFPVCRKTLRGQNQISKIVLFHIPTITFQE